MSEDSYPMKPKFSGYQEVLDYLYTQLPMFQRVGSSAFKKDLTNTIAFCDFLDHPEHKFKSVHIAGTNGKGSSSHYLAAILQSAGYKTGLYTSPHLKNFTERIKINGREIPHDEVVDFVNRALPFIEETKPSFFELTVGMAFDYFARKRVDIAIVEVGMGGRLDSTNVVIPEVALITNISADHQQWLGDTPELVAGEKAGIIKKHIPVVVSEKQEEIAGVFAHVAQQKGAPIYFAADDYQALFKENGMLEVSGFAHDFDIQPAGDYQTRNIPGVLKTIDILRTRGFQLSDSAVLNGIEQMKKYTGLKGRWQVLGTKPLTVCDVGHNQAGLEYIVNQIERTPHKNLHMILGTVRDKDISAILHILPKGAAYYFCEANIPRAMPADELYTYAVKHGLIGKVIKDVNAAIAEAKSAAAPEDLIFIGGSTFVVAEIEDL